MLLPLDQGTRGHWTGRQPDSTKLGQSTTAAASRQDALKFSGKWAICKTTVDRIIFQSTARLPQSVRAAAKRFGGELTDSDQLSQLREAVDQRQNSKAKSCHSCLAPTQSVTGEKHSLATSNRCQYSASQSSLTLKIFFHHN